MYFDKRQIPGVIIGVLVGFFLSTVLRKETAGDRIVTTARGEQSPAVVLIGPTGNVRVLDSENGRPINDCKSSDCRTEVVVSQLGEPQLINKATGKPVEKIFNEQRVVEYNFEINPTCRRFWPGGEICW